MQTFRFTVYGEPVAKGRPKFVRATGRTYTPKKTVEYENLVRLSFATAGGEKFLDDSILRMQIRAYFRIPSSFSKKKQAACREGIVRPAKKPDADNIIKSICDALNDVAYKDDAQVVEVQLRKFYSDEPRVEVFLSEIAE